MKKTLILLSLSLGMLASCGDNTEVFIEEESCNDNCWEMKSRIYYDEEVCGLYGGQPIICPSYIYTVKNICTGLERNHITRFYYNEPPTLGNIYCDDVYEDEFLN